MIFIELLMLLLNVILIFKFKSILLQLILIVSFFPLLTLVAFMNGFPVPGVLEYQRPVFTDPILYTGFFLLAFFNCILIIILYPIRNKVYSFTPFKCNNISFFILLCIAFLSAVISYPRVFGIDIGVDLSTIYISSNVALLLCKRELFNWGTLAHMLLLIVVILGGDRVDSIVTFVLLMVMNVKEDVATESIKKSYFIVLGGALFIMSVISGILRDGNSISIISLTSSLYAQQTVSDVLYVFLCSIGYFFENGMHLEVLANLLFGLFPGPFYGVTSHYNYTIFLLDNYLPNPGGGLFISEAMIALGPIGVILYCLIFAFSVKKLYLNQNKYIVTLFLLCFCMLCRIEWYGFIYAYKPILFSFAFYWLFKDNLRNVLLYKEPFEVNKNK